MNQQGMKSLIVSLCWWAGLFLFGTLILIGMGYRNARQVEVVMYNDMNTSIEDAVLVCEEEVVLIDGLAVEASWHRGFSPKEQSTVLRLKSGGTGEEQAWSVAWGDRLTLHLASNGEVLMTRETSWVRRWLDALIRQ